MKDMHDRKHILMEWFITLSPNFIGITCILVLFYLKHPIFEILVFKVFRMLLKFYAKTTFCVLRYFKKLQFSTYVTE